MEISFKKDKDYFFKLWQAIKSNWKQNLTSLIGSILVLAAFYFYNVIEIWLFVIILFVSLILIFSFSQNKIKIPKLKVIFSFSYWKIKMPKLKKDTSSHVNPVSLGTLYLSFVLSMWTSITIKNSAIFSIAVIFSVISASFFLATFIKPIQVFISQYVARFLITLTSIAVVLGFVLDLLPIASSQANPFQQVLFYFGFLWLIAILLVMYRDVKFELIRILSVIVFIFLACIRFTELDAVGTIGGITLLVIAFLCYHVAVGIIVPFGKLED